MIRSLIIDGYRGFAQFEMQDVVAVNLLVGRNNSGKTSLLEALLLLAGHGDPSVLWGAMNRRGERFVLEARDSRGRYHEIDVCHLFHGHKVGIGTAFTITATRDDAPQRISYSIRQAPQQSLPFTEEAEVPAGTMALVIEGGSSKEPTSLELTARGGLTFDTIRRNPTRAVRPDELNHINYVGTESMDPEELGRLWEGVVLKPEEERIIEALRTIEPMIERIAFVPSTPRFPRLVDRSGFIVKLSNGEEPVPIGSMGDGIWRMLALALASSRPQGGLLLVDEIDTGLHYTVMKDMWRLIRTVSAKFGLQVFATSHSDDCIQSLAAICREDSVGPGQVCIHRIEPELGQSIRFTEPEIIAAAERRIEVR